MERNLPCIIAPLKLRNALHHIKKFEVLKDNSFVFTTLQLVQLNEGRNSSLYCKQYYFTGKGNSESYVRKPNSTRDTALLYNEMHINAHLKYLGIRKPRKARHMPWTAACLSPSASPLCHCTLLQLNCHTSSLRFGKKVCNYKTLRVLCKNKRF